MRTAVLYSLAIYVRAFLLPATPHPFKHSNVSVVILRVRIVALCTNHYDISVVTARYRIAELIK